MVILGTRTLYMMRLVWRDATLHNFAGGDSWYISSMIDAGERDKSKAWRKIGAVFASPEVQGNTASTDTVFTQIDYSLDGGATWITGSPASQGRATPSPTTTTARSITPSGAVSNFLMVRIVWKSISDWAPILTGLWAEFEALDSPSRRRRWTFTVQAEDRVIDRNGQTLTRTGRQQITELWKHWQNGTTIPFRDLDYDSDPTDRTVRIVGITESSPYHIRRACGVSRPCRLCWWRCDRATQATRRRDHSSLDMPISQRRQAAINSTWSGSRFRSSGVCRNSINSSGIPHCGQRNRSSVMRS